MNRKPSATRVKRELIEPEIKDQVLFDLCFKLYKYDSNLECLIDAMQLVTVEKYRLL